MSTLDSDRPGRRRPLTVFLVIIVIVLLGGAYFLAPRFEREPPQVKFTPDADALGLAPIEIGITDQGAGLTSVTVTLSSGGAEYTLANEQFAQVVTEKKITVVLSSKLAGLKEGPAALSVSARDGSMWNFFRGNETVVRKTLTIDITPPTVELVADDRYVNFGGVGVIVYKSSADTVTSGIRIGGYFSRMSGLIPTMARRSTLPSISAMTCRSPNNTLSKPRTAELSPSQGIWGFTATPSSWITAWGCIRFIAT